MSPFLLYKVVALIKDTSKGSIPLFLAIKTEIANGGNYALLSSILCF